jgi:hypothetical protein
MRALVVDTSRGFSGRQLAADGPSATARRRKHRSQARADRCNHHLPDHDAIKWNRIMISSLFEHDLRANAFAFVARENRFPLFRIMLLDIRFQLPEGLSDGSLQPTQDRSVPSKPKPFVSKRSSVRGAAENDPSN